MSWWDDWDPPESRRPETEYPPEHLTRGLALENGQILTAPLPEAPKPSKPFPWLPVAVGSLALVAALRPSQPKVKPMPAKGEVTEDREVMYVTAMKTLNDPRQLRTLADKVQEFGFPEWAKNLRARADTKEKPDSVKEQYRAAFRKGLTSTDKVKVRQLASMFRAQGSWGSAEALESHADGLPDVPPAPPATHAGEAMAERGDFTGRRSGRDIDEVGHPGGRYGSMLSDGGDAIGMNPFSRGQAFPPGVSRPEDAPDDGTTLATSSGSSMGGEADFGLTPTLGHPQAPRMTVPAPHGQIGAPRAPMGGHPPAGFGPPAPHPMAPPPAPHPMAPSAPHAPAGAPRAPIVGPQPPPPSLAGYHPSGFRPPPPVARPAPPTGRAGVSYEGFSGFNRFPSSMMHGPRRYADDMFPDLSMQGGGYPSMPDASGTLPISLPVASGASLPAVAATVMPDTYTAVSDPTSTSNDPSAVASQALATAQQAAGAAQSAASAASQAAQAVQTVPGPSTPDDIASADTQSDDPDAAGVAGEYRIDPMTRRPVSGLGKPVGDYAVGGKPSVRKGMMRG